MSAGIKMDQGKPRFELIASEFLFGLATVLTDGAAKYSGWNWAKGLQHMRVFGALMRHLWAWHRGENLDPESGRPHLDHAACELMFLRVLTEKRKDLDDRWCWDQTPTTTDEFAKKLQHIPSLTDSPGLQAP